MSVNKIECVEPKELRSDAVAVICVISILAAFVLIGTLYDVVVVQLKMDSHFGNSYELASTDNRVHCHSNGSSQEKVTSVEMSSVKGQIPVETVEENAKGSGLAQSTRPPKSKASLEEDSEDNVVLATDTGVC